MKKTGGVIIICLFLTQHIIAQKKDIVLYKQNWDQQRIFWGYYLGINNKDFKVSYTTYLDPNGKPYFVDVKPSIGFNVGLIGDLRLHKNFSLRLEPGLSSNTKTVIFTNINGPDQNKIRQINATYLRIPLLLKFNADRFNNMRPYLIGGISYDYNFSSNQNNPNDNETGNEFRMKTSNYTYELGVGIDLYLPYFIFSPSIRGIFAINNELVYDNKSNSPYTSPIAFLGTRGVFINFAFH